MLAEIADVSTQVFLMNEPLVQFFGTTDVKGCRQQEKWSGGEQWKEDSDYTQCQAEAT